MNFQSPVTEEEAADIDPAKFAFAVTRIATSQICQSVGFTAIQNSALNTLTDVAARYLRALAESALSSASSSGRTQSNLYDVVRALEDLGSVRGFRGAWNVNQPLLASSTLIDLSKFVEYTDEIPFAKPIPRRISSPEKSVPSAMPMGVLHIPKWLPAFPEMGGREINGKEEEEETQEEVSSNGIGSCGEVDRRGCLVDEKMKMGLPEKRARVRFKMCLGVGRGRMEREGEGLVDLDLRSGICRGGKRVSCQNRIDQEREDHKGKKRKNDVHPKRRRGRRN